MINFFNNLTSQSYITRKKSILPPSIPENHLEKTIWVSITKKRLVSNPKTKIILSKVPDLNDYLNKKEQEELRSTLVRLSADQNCLWKTLGVLAQSNHKYEYYLQYALLPYIALKAPNLGIYGIYSRLLRIYREKTLGFKDLLSENFKSLKRKKRIQYLNIRDMISYSYINDLRFVFLYSLILGLVIWWVVSPEMLFLKPTAAICSPDLKLISRVLRNTYIEKVCSTHINMKSPCICGEPLNQMVKRLFPELHYDPLNLKSQKKDHKIRKAFSVYIASIILCLILKESTSIYGIMYVL